MKKQVNKLVFAINKLCNLHPDTNQKWILFSMALSMLLLTYVSPVMLKTVITLLPSEWLAFESLVLSVTGLVIGILWRGKTREKAIKNFAVLAITESVCTFLLGMYLCFVDFNPWMYAIASLIYISLVSVFVGKCLMFFKSKLWQERDREIYDNNVSIVSGITCIVGYLLAIMFAPPLKVALFIWGVTHVLDDFGWIVVYLKNKKCLNKC